ncbi:MAG: right-handed parallel beta-helix repeat-containing protein, partial [Sphingomonadaceae bacterium]
MHNVPNTQQAPFVHCRSGNNVRTGRRPLLLFGLAAAAALALGADPALAATYTVSTTAELQSALAKAVGGDTIRLNPGSYGYINIASRNFGGAGVVIRPATSRPRLTRLQVSSSSGITLLGLDVIGTNHPLVGIHGSSDILLAGLTLRGSENNDPWDDSNSGLHIRNSNRVSFTNSRVHDFKVGLFIQRSNGVVIADNEFSYLREGMNIAAADRLLIYRNRFQNFFPRYDLGEHPDAIQFWMTNETVQSRNVVIADNYIATGGPRAVQGRS